MAIQQLPETVQSMLRSGVVITSPAQTIVELVLNSLDAEATSITVRADLKLFSLEVVDNGCGMGLEQLNAIGPRFMTSKCHTLEDLHNNLIHYGFRGEALASLREVSGLLLLISRPSGSKETYCKAFTHNQAQDAVVSSTNRPSCGTTVTIQDFMFNMPVRRKRICEAVDLEEIRSYIECIALMHPQVSFSIRDDSKGSMILQKHKSADTLTCFNHLFGQAVAQSLAPIEFTSSKFKITGYISKEAHRQKHMQFIYVNKRVIVKTKLHRLVNILLTKSSILRTNGPWRHRPIPKGVSANRWLAFPSPEKRKKFPAFLINIECASKEYDVCLDPKKTLIEFDDWTEVLKCIEDAIRKFLEKEHLVFEDEETVTNSQEWQEGGGIREEESDVLRAKRSEGIQHEIDARNNLIDDEINIPRMIHGLPAKRRNKEKDTVMKPTLHIKYSEENYVDNGNCRETVCAMDDSSNRTNRTPEISINNDKIHEGQSLNQFNKKTPCPIGSGPPIVMFREKYEQSSVGNLKISRGAYLFKLEEAKQRRITNISNVLQKYNMSVIKTKFKHENKTEEESVNNTDSSLKDANKHCDFVESKCITTTENILLKDDNEIQDENNDKHKANTVIENVICHVNGMPEKQVKKLPVEICSYMDIPTITNKQVLSHKPASTRSKNPIQINENLHSHKEDWLESSLEMDLNLTESSPCQNVKRFSTTEDFICPLKTILAKERKLKQHQCNKKWYSESKNHPLFSRKNSEINESRINHTNDTTYHKKRTKILDEYNETKEECDSEYIPDSHFVTDRNYNIHSSDSDSSNIAHTRQHTNMQESLIFDVESSDSHGLISKQQRKRYSNIMKPTSKLESVTDNDTVCSFFQSNKTQSRLHENLFNMEFEEMPLTEVQSKEKFSGFTTETYISDSLDTENENIQSLTIQLNTRHLKNHSHIESLDNLTCNIEELHSLASESYQSKINNPSENSDYDIENIETPYIRNEIKNIKNNLIFLDLFTFGSNRDISNLNRQSRSFSDIENHTELLDSSRYVREIKACKSHSNVKNLSSVLDNLKCNTAIEEISSMDVESQASDLRDSSIGNRVSFSEYTSQQTTSIAECNPISTQESLQFNEPIIYAQNNETPDFEKKILRNLKYWTLNKCLSMSEMEIISIPTLSSPYFVNKSTIESRNDGNKSFVIETMSDEISMNEGPNENSMIDIPCSQLSPLRIDDSSNTDLENHYLIDSQDMGESTKCSLNKEPLDTEVCESPYFSFKPVLNDKIQFEMEVDKSVGRKRNSDSDFSDIYGKKTILEHENDESDIINSSQLNNNNEDISNSITSMDMIKVYDDAVNNLVINEEKSNVSKDVIKCNKIIEDRNKKKVNPNNTTDCSQEWVKMKNKDGKIFYFHVHSGMTSYQRPPTNNQMSFTMTERYMFVPKGMSPILDDSVPTVVKGTSEMTPISRQALHDDIRNLAAIGCDDLLTVKWKEPPDPNKFACKDLVKQLLETAESRAQYYGKQVPSTSKVTVKMSNSIYHYKYDTEIFSNIQIIGQWDNKFILTVVSSEKGKRPHVIGVFDQHAVHERIRLEKLMRDYLEEGSNSHFKSTKIDPHIILDLTGKEFRIMSSFSDKFERLGLEYTELSDYRISVIKVPTCLHARDVRERSKGTVLKNFLEILIQEEVEYLIKTRGNEPRVPNILREIINYEACRGAIKFGDSLTKEECETLLENLSKCELPFYCAHGRPSFVPIFDMTDFKLQKSTVMNRDLRVTQLISTL